MEHRLQHPRFAVYVLFGSLVLDCMGFKEKVKLHVPSFFHFLTCFDMFDYCHLLPIIIQDHTGTLPSKLLKSILPRQCNDRAVPRGSAGSLKLPFCQGNQCLQGRHWDQISGTLGALDSASLFTSYRRMSTDSAAETSISGVLFIIPTLWCIMVYIC